MRRWILCSELEQETLIACSNPDLVGYVVRGKPKAGLYDELTRALQLKNSCHAVLAFYHSRTPFAMLYQIQIQQLRHY